MAMIPFQLERYFAAHEFAVRYLLCASDCETMSVAELLALEPDAQSRLMSLPLGYSDAEGPLELREAIAGLYTDTSPREVLTHAGAQEAIFAFMTACFEPGDAIIVHDPAYQSLQSAAVMRGVEVIPWRARPEAAWQLDPDELPGLLRRHPRVRALVINHPHNPTGALLSHDRFARVVEVARSHGCYLFHDEVYRGLEHDPALRLPAICDVYERGVTLGVLSKTYGLAGLRVGWVATHDEGVRAAMATCKDYLSICNSQPGAFLAAVALRHHQTLARRSLERILANLTLADAFFAQHSTLFDWRRPSAGPMAFVRVRSDATALCDHVRREAGVLLLPGAVFGDDYRDFVRFGFGRADAPEALSALDEALSRRGSSG